MISFSFLKFYSLILERCWGWKRERVWLAPPPTHPPLVVGCVCPPLGWSLQPWHVWMMVQPVGPGARAWASLIHLWWRLQSLLDLRVEIFNQFLINYILKNCSAQLSPKNPVKNVRCFSDTHTHTHHAFLLLYSFCILFCIFSIAYIVDQKL